MVDGTDVDGAGSAPGMPGAGGNGGGPAWLERASDEPLVRLMDDNFLQYAAYVIRDRAIPDIEDGLKPVQRRILYSLHENDDGKFIKVANIAGYCMQYHPHGNVSIEDALVSLANKRYLIEGQGNFGNIYTGDPAAASRYIECRLTDLARNQLFNEKLTRFVPSYDGKRKEPVTLPAKLPLLLMLGAEGIAVGLSMKVLPHNFPELLQAQIAILRKRTFEVIPDFQQGGSVDVSEYQRGNGKVRIRALIEPHPDRAALVVREIPFGTTTDALIASIEDAARKKKIKIRSISDYTAEQVEIEIVLAPGEDADKAVQALYAFTDCEVSVSVRAIVIQENRPVETDVEGILRYNTRRLVAILKRELELEQKRLEDELHFKTLAQLFIEHRIYKRIEECETYRAVQDAVLDGMNAFREHLRRDVTLTDVERLLAIPIKRISRFDIHKNRQEIGDILAALDDVQRWLSDVTGYAVDYLKKLLKGAQKEFPRRTRVEAFEQVARRELVRDEFRIGWDRDKGYVGTEAPGEALFTCSSYDKVLLVWEDGRYKVTPPPDKLFVDQDLIHCAKYDRDREYLAVYTHEQVTYMKRFTLGGAIMNKDYRLAPEGARMLLLTDQQPPEIYVKYKPAKRQKINRQVFRPEQVAVKSAKSRGIQITVKRVASVSATKPSGWDRGKKTPRGVPIEG